jgi:hypothetical protein
MSEAGGSTRTGYPRAPAHCPRARAAQCAVSLSSACAEHLDATPYSDGGAELDDFAACATAGQCTCVGTVPFAYRLQGEGALQSHINSSFDELFAAVIDQRGISEKLKALLATAALKLDSIQYGQLVEMQADLELSAPEDCSLFSVHSTHIEDPNSPKGTVLVRALPRLLCCS